MLAIAPALGQATWITQFSAGNASCLALADTESGVFAVGVTDGNLVGQNQGLHDAWIGRLDGNGKKVWLAQVGTYDNDYANVAAPDGRGGVFVGGYTEAGLGGPNLGATDTWLASYGGDGQRHWIIQVGTAKSEVPRAAASDGSDGFYVAGSTNGDFGGLNLGSDDAWLARFDSEGHELWIRKVATKRGEWAATLVGDGSGGVYVGGTTYGELARENPYPYDGDAWLAHFAADGTQLWIKQFGTENREYCTAAGLDGAGNLYATGSTWGDFGGPFQGPEDTWLARFDASGNEIWVTQFSNSEGTTATALGGDGADGAFVAGYSMGDLGQPNKGHYDAWLTRFDSTGVMEWATMFGTADGEKVFGLVAKETGAVIAGETAGCLAKAPDAIDAWIARLDDPPPCPADLNHDGVLDLFDFLMFFNYFNKHDYRANCDGECNFEIFDFLCFVNDFNTGC